MGNAGVYFPDNQPDVSQGPTVLAIIWTLLSISTIIVAGRLFVKLRVTGRLWWDDYLLIVAELMGYVHGILITMSVHYGFGRHMDFLEPQALSATLHWGMMSFLGGYLSPLFGRISFCVFLLSIVWKHPRIPRWPLYVFILIQFCFNTVTAVLTYAQCGTHLSDIWDLNLPSMYRDCLDFKVQTYWNYAAGSINSFTDLFLTILPAVIISFSSLSRKSRLGLVFLLCLSCVAMIAAIKKTIEAKNLSRFTDYTYDLCDYVEWISIELNIVIIASSIPILRPLFKRNGLSRVLQREVTEMSGDDDHHHIVVTEEDVEKNGAQMRSASVSSREKILPGGSGRREPFTITRTVEVSVAVSLDDTALAHATLIGLPID